jgi:hypothetical protein
LSLQRPILPMKKPLILPLLSLFFALVAPLQGMDPAPEESVEPQNSEIDSNQYFSQLDAIICQSYKRGAIFDQEVYVSTLKNLFESIHNPYLQAQIPGQGIDLEIEQRHFIMRIAQALTLIIDYSQNPKALEAMIQGLSLNMTIEEAQAIFQNAEAEGSTRTLFELKANQTAACFPFLLQGWLAKIFQQNDQGLNALVQNLFGFNCLTFGRQFFHYCGIDKMEIRTYPNEKKYESYNRDYPLHILENFIETWLSITPGADAIKLIHPSKCTPLHLAACHGWINIVRTLIERGADVNALDHLGNTPLHYVVNQRPPNPRYPRGNTVAYNEALTTVIQMLLDNGAQLNLENADELNPIGLEIMNIPEHPLSATLLAEFLLNHPRYLDNENQELRNLVHTFWGERATPAEELQVNEQEGSNTFHRLKNHLQTRLIRLLEWRPLGYATAILTYFITREEPLRSVPLMD